jgi:hypothetical protein
VGNTNKISLVHGDDVALTKIAMSPFLKIISNLAVSVLLTEEVVSSRFAMSLRRRIFPRSLPLCA